jgi:hypothetical protein
MPYSSQTHFQVESDEWEEPFRWSCEVNQREMLCTAMESRGRKWKYLRVTSLYDPNTSWVAKHESPHSGFATMLNPRLSHSRTDELIMFEG